MAARGSLRIIKALVLVILAVGGLTSLVSSSQDSGVGKPELHPTTLILDPASPVDQGRLVNVLAKLENSGASPAPEFKVEFFIRLRPLGGDVPSWQSFAVSQRRGLSAEEQEVEAQGVLDTSNPALVPSPGIYEIRAVVDSNDQIPESDENNNELIVSLLVQSSKLGKADLRPQAMTFEPPSPIAQGQMVLVTTTVINTGDKDAGPFIVSFFYCRITEGQSACSIAFTEFGRRPFAGGLPKGGSQETAAPLATQDLGLDSGIYLIKVFVDSPDADNPSGVITEQDEANNELITVLSIQGPEVHPTSLSFNPPLPHLGDTVKVITTVDNSGQATARNVEVSFFVDGAEFGGQTVTIEGGGQATVEGFLKTAVLNLEIGIHTIRVVVDPRNQISERDETNNEIRTALTLQTAIPRLPELHPKSIVVNPRSPVELDANPDLTILTETVNTGEINARNFDVAFFYRLTGSVRWIPLPCTANCTISELPSGTGIISEGKLNLFGITAGKYEVRTLVDPADSQNVDGKVKELDESNNEMKSAVTLLIARKPDLFIDPFSLRLDPSFEIRRGTSLNIAVDAINIGEQAAQGTFTVEFSLRRLEEEVFTVFARQDVNGLGVGERAPLRVKLDSAAIRPGLYELQILADSDNRFVELSEDNNVFRTGPDPRNALFVRGPDLTVLSLQMQQSSFTPGLPNITPGAQVPLVAQVTNIGVEATGNFEIQFCLQRLGDNQCTPFGNRTSFPGLGIGVVVQATATLDTRSVAQGSYIIEAVVDPTAQGKPFGQVDEENEQNNVGILPVQIGSGGGVSTPPGGTGSGQADLTALSLTLSPDVAQLGEIVWIEAQVANIGREDAGRFRVSFFWRRLGETRSVFFAGMNLGGLATGGRQTVLAQLNTIEFLLQGTFEILVVVDFNNEVKELDENNNRLTKQLQVN